MHCSADTQGHQRCPCLVFAAGATSPSDLWSRVLLDQPWPMHRESSSQIQINSLDVIHRLSSTCPLPRDAPDKARILPGIPASDGTASPSQYGFSQHNKTNSHLPQQLGFSYQTLTTTYCPRYPQYSFKLGFFFPPV